MPVFRVTSPDGSAYDVTAPDGASGQDALAVAQAHHNALASFATNSQGNPAAGATLAAATSPGIPSTGAARQAACTAAGYECVQDGFPPKQCYNAEQLCNEVAHTYMGMPINPPRSGTTVFPNGSTVVAPSGFDPVRGVKLAPPGQPRAQ